ncbi:MAG: histidine phosphatase family protein, partial [Saprospiraceae bacterium]|nr:histidine phosphatase family protein [Saprospiraceae bacterium]
NPNSRKTYFIPGKHGYMSRKIFPEIAEKYPNTITVQVENIDEPSQEDYANGLKDYDLKNSVIIAHSMGCPAIINYISENNTPIEKLVLIAPKLIFKEKDRAKRYTKMLEDLRLDKLETLVKELVIIYSDNDEHVTLEDISESIKKQLPYAKYVLQKDADHFATPELDIFPEYLWEVIKDNGNQLNISVLRHGETEYNKLGKFHGITDIELNETGREQAHEAKEKLGAHYDVIISSPLKRARQTAEIVNEKLGLKIIENDLLKERDFGNLEGLTWEEFSEQYPNEASKNHIDFQPELEKGERIEDVEKRLREFINWLKTSGYKNPLIVTHAGVIRVIERKLNNLTPEQSRENDPKNLELRNYKLSAAEWVQDEDVLDTWFSSGQWPYLTLMVKEGDFNEFYPSQVMETGWDILLFWVTRMMLLNPYRAKKLNPKRTDEQIVPFKSVYLHGLVLDKNGVKMSKRLGNVIDPFETIATYGADATRWYMISNAQPWDNLKFDLEGIDEIRRKFFGTLFNTYNFFILYANIDTFQYKEDYVPVSERPEIDRWIISKLNHLIQDVQDDFSDYEPTNATRKIMEFVDEHLSNWYVRLCRRRFWKGEYGLDKIAAYQTLYDCLLNISKLSAPVAPMFSEWLYNNLNSATGREVHESVHLADFPVANLKETDDALEQRMDYAQRISSVVHSIRKKVGHRVRQPLAKIILPIIHPSFIDQVEAVKELILSEVNIKKIEYITDTEGFIKKKAKANFKTLGKSLGKNMKDGAAMIAEFDQAKINELEKKGVISLTINGEAYSITPEDVEISFDNIPGWQVGIDKDITVALDISLDDALIHEGLAKELVNRIQNMRKNADLNVTDKISVVLEKHDVLEETIRQFGDYIKQEVLAETITFAGQVNDEKVEISDEIQIAIGIAKI